MSKPTIATEIKCEHGNFVPAINGICKDCRIKELEEKKTPTPYSVADVQIMSEQLVRTTEELEAAEQEVERLFHWLAYEGVDVSALEEAEATIKKVRELLNQCVPVIANSRNTKSVRDGLEQSGYIKYVEMTRTTYIQFKKALIGDGDES